MLQISSDSFSQRHTYTSELINFDALPIACAMYRIHGNTNNDRFVNFANGGDVIGDLITKTITDEDIATADRVERHFSAQIMSTILEGKALSNFQIAVEQYFRSGRREIPEPSGLIHRLPEFYDYDVQLGQMREEHFTNSPRTHDLSPTQTMSLIPLRQLQKHTQAVDHQHYWFQEPQTQTGVLIKVRTTDPTTHIWSSFFKNSPRIDITAKFLPMAHPSGFNYWLVGNKWQVENL